ncbi:MAG TPA: AAA family ATPase [Leptospiraceae bacterium]|nr:AAA family ATPase [Leptospiraceae bacterium]HNF15671.1 AAA family ATPase [Leptospiraceae bacterium]HNI95489.1 AAA family ATPase [Leptospiraceae bacterium]HNM04787.1 AAA family ATPase [Leptospiraceae bacterium]HNN03880.1 AAA family ATPase [Leptospiraceae bacterium]
MEFDLKKIEERKKNLEFVRTELKDHFVGIDFIIDSLLDYIQIWYLMPEILTRPIIVNLWGMTGVGKTDLVRRLVKLLDYTDRFCEIELSNIDETSYHTSVSSVLSRNKLNDGRPCIVLFDEIQRFNTKDHDGNPLPQAKFTDFWELLSDGRLSKKEKDNIDQYITNFLFQKSDIKLRKSKGEEMVDENPAMNMWEANEIFQMLNMEVDSDNMIDITQQQMLELLLREKGKKKIYEPIDHSRTLIIISGNLDEAYSMADEISEADVDADIFHAFTKKITDVDIKNALSRKFRPEQVARFGNIHLIYRSLKKAEFEILIEKEILRIQKSMQERFSIQVEIDRSINRLIYRNGVFPVQGVRPVFSSIVDILESNLTKLIFEAMMESRNRISIAYSVEKKRIEAFVGEREHIIPYVGRIDKIRESNVRDNVTSISVHESGHAVAYMVLTGLSPLQLKSRVANSYAGGFTFPHLVYETKETMTDKIRIFLAGGIAEEIIFGEKHASVGRIQDRREATVLVLDYVRTYGFNSEYQSTYTLSEEYEMNKYATDSFAERMMVKLVEETRVLLVEHIELLKSLSLVLSEKGSLESSEVAEIGLKFGVKTEIREEGYLKIAGFGKILSGENE